MSIQYTPKMFLRQIPNPLLREWPWRSERPRLGRVGREGQGDHLY